MMSLEKAIQRCFDRINLDPAGESVEIYKYMYQYKAIRELPPEQFDALYEQFAEDLGFCR